MDEDRGQGTRAEQETQRRRRRGNDDLAPDAKLAIPPEIAAQLKAEGRTPRWANDEGNRIHNLTVLDDYDKVAGVDPVPIGTAKDGTPIMAHLLSKPAEFIREDQRERDKRRSEVEQSLFRSPDAPDAAGQGSNPNPASAERYVAKETRLQRRREGSEEGRANQL